MTQPKMTDAQRIERLERCIVALTVGVQKGPGTAVLRPFPVLGEVADEVEGRAES